MFVWGLARLNALAPRSSRAPQPQPPAPPGSARSGAGASSQAGAEEEAETEQEEEREEERQRAERIASSLTASTSSGSSSSSEGNGSSSRPARAPRNGITIRPAGFEAAVSGQAAAAASSTAALTLTPPKAVGADAAVEELEQWLSDAAGGHVAAGAGGANTTTTSNTGNTGSSSTGDAGSGSGGGGSGLWARGRAKALLALLARALPAMEPQHLATSLWALAALQLRPSQAWLQVRARRPDWGRDSGEAGIGRDGPG